MDEQEALRRVAAVAAGGAPPEAVFEAVTTEVSALLGGGLTTLTRFEGGGTESVVVARTGDHIAVGARLPVVGENSAARILRSGRAARIDDYTGVPGTAPAVALGLHAGVAVPVAVGGELWGSLGVSSRTGPLPAGTEDRLAVFAEIAAAAVASAAARESMRVLAEEQAALLRVAGLVAQGAREAELFDAVTVEAARLVDDEATTLVRYEGGRTFTILATRHGPAPVGLVVTVPPDDAGTLAELLRTWRPVRIDRHDAVGDRSYSKKEFGVGSSVAVPVIVNGRLWGSLGSLTEGRRLPAETEGRLAKFAELVGSALANVEARAELQRFGEEQAALRRVAELAARGMGRDAVLRAILDEASLLFDDASVTVWTRSAPTPTGPSAIVRRVVASGRPVRVDGSTPGVGVPIHGEDGVWGALVALRPHRLPPGTEDRLTQFAQVLATAVAGERSRSAIRRVAAEQAALRRVAELAARGAALDEVFVSVATEASSILGDAPANLLRFDEDGTATVVAARCSPVPVGLRYVLTENTAARRVMLARRPVRLEALAGSTRSDVARRFNIGAMVAVPVFVEGRVWGMLATTTEGAPPPADAEDRLGEFAELAAAAIASAENKAKLRASRARVVTTADETRQRLQRDVHDGAQQRLVQTVLTLQLGLDAADRGEDTTSLLREALEHAERATVELRDLVHGILPASLTRGGLRAGLESLVAGLAVPVDLDVTAAPPGRLAGEIEVTAYFVAAEALTNVVKHAKASRATVRVTAAPGRLGLEIADDGVGGADARAGTGLTGLADRVEAMDGTLLVTSAPGAGTTVSVTLPVED